MSVTREIVRFVAAARFGDLPETAIAATKGAILNILGNCVAGARTRIGALHVETAKDMGGGREQATILGDGARVSVPLAAYANGNLAFALDFEDTLYYITHPGFITVSSGLAVAEHRGRSGQDLLLAICLGYEVLGRMGPAMQPTPERGKQVFGEQYHPFGGAVTAGKLLGLSEDALDSAFGIAGTYASVPSAYKYFGVVAETRPMREVKLGWGWMSMAGTLAALSAERGFAGGHGVLDGAHGFHVMAGSDRVDVPRLTRDLGSRWLVTDTEFKVYPAIARNTPPYLATRALVLENDLHVDDIARITVRGMQMHLVGDFGPRSAVDAQFSLPYAVAAAVLRLEPGPRLYDNDRLQDPQMRSLLARITLEHDADADALFFNAQRQVFTVHIDLKSGRRVSRDIEFPREQPRLDWNGLCRKFRSLCDGILPDGQTGEVIDRVADLDRQPDVGRLVRSLVP